MNSDINTADDGDYVIRGLCSCKIQGVAICHRDGYCSCCPIALTHLNPGSTLHDFMTKVSL